MSDLTATGGMDAATINGKPLLAAIQQVDGIGSGVDADLVRGVGLDGSPFVAGGITGVPGFGVVAPRGRFTGNAYPTALLGV